MLPDLMLRISAHNQTAPGFSQAEAGLKRLEGQARQTGSAFAAAGGRAGIGAFALGINPATAAALAFGMALHGTGRALEQFGTIADHARTAGVDAEWFMAISHEAKLAGVGVDQLAGAMKTFATNAGLAAEDKGRMVSTLEALDPLLLDSIKKAATQEERFKAVADAMERTGDAAKESAILTAAFGGEGAKLAPLFEGGAVAVDKMVESAKELGLTVSSDLIESADALGDEWETIATILDLQVKSALVGLAPVMVDLLSLAGGLTQEFNEMLAAAKQGPREFAGWLAGRKPGEIALRDIMGDMAGELGAFDIGRALNEDRSGGIAEYFMGGGIDRSNVVGSGINRRDFENIFGVRLKSTPVTPPTNDYGSNWGTWATLGKGLTGVGGIGGSGLTLPAGDDGPVATVRELNSAYQLLADDGISAAIERTNDLRDSIAEGLTDSVMGVFRAFREGGDVLGSITDQLTNIGDQLMSEGLRQMFSAVLSGVMGAAGAPSFGGTGFGAYGMYADGTPSASPGWALVGEEGPELVRFRGGERVVPHGQSMEMMRSERGSESMVFNITVNSDSRQHAAEVADRTVEVMRREFPGMLRRYQKNPYRT